MERLSVSKCPMPQTSAGHSEREQAIHLNGQPRLLGVESGWWWMETHSGFREAAPLTRSGKVCTLCHPPQSSTLFSRVVPCTPCSALVYGWASLSFYHFLYFFLSAWSHQDAFFEALPELLNGAHPSSLDQRVSTFPLKDKVRGRTCLHLPIQNLIQASLWDPIWLILPSPPDATWHTHGLIWLSLSSPFSVHTPPSFLPSAILLLLPFFFLLFLCFSEENL